MTDPSNNLPDSVEALAAQAQKLIQVDQSPDAVALRKQIAGVVSELYRPSKIAGLDALHGHLTVTFTNKSGDAASALGVDIDANRKPSGSPVVVTTDPKTADTLQGAMTPENSRIIVGDSHTVHVRVDMNTSPLRP